MLGLWVCVRSNFNSTPQNIPKPKPHIPTQPQTDAPAAPAPAPSAAPWAFSHRDVFDLIGKHKYDHTLPDLLSALAGPQAGGKWQWIVGWDWMGLVVGGRR